MMCSLFLLLTAQIVLFVTSFAIEALNENEIVTAEVSANGESSDWKRGLRQSGIDLLGARYALIEQKNSRAYPPISSEDIFEYRINGDSVRRNLIGLSSDHTKADKWIAVDHEDAVLGCSNDGTCGLYIRHSALESGLNVRLDSNTDQLQSRRLSSIDGSLVTKQCIDESCDYMVDVSSLMEDNIASAVRFDSSEIMARCSGGTDQSCGIMVSTDALMRRLSGQIYILVPEDQKGPGKKGKDEKEPPQSQFMSDDNTCARLCRKCKENVDKCKVCCTQACASEDGHCIGATAYACVELCLG